MSTKNAKVKELKKLHTAKGRREAGMYLLEGEHLFLEAQAAEQGIREVLVTERYIEKNSAGPFEYTIVSEEVMNALSQTETPQGIICVLAVPVEEWAGKALRKIVMLDGLQDPGNAGTIVRTADAAGFDAVIFGDGSVDPYNDKVIRSMQGSQFHIPLYRMNLLAAIRQLKNDDIPVYGTALDERALDFREAPKSETVAVILGNEGSGVSAEVLAETNSNLYIPIVGRAESLNVAIAGGILLYHFL